MRWWWQKVWCEGCPLEIHPTEPQADVGGGRYHLNCYPRATPPHVTHFVRKPGSYAPIFWAEYLSVGMPSVPSEWEVHAASVEREARMFGGRWRRRIAGHRREAPSLRRLLRSARPALAAAALLVALAIAPALANHWPPEVGYLNGTASLGMYNCRNLDTEEQLPCEALHDVQTEILYVVVRREGRIILVFKKRGYEKPSVVYRGH